MFGTLLNETLTLRKKSTGHLHKFRANVQPSRSLIFTDNASLPVEEGDSIDRALSTSVETYTVVERGYYQAVHGVPAHYQMKVRKNIGEESKTPGRSQPKTHLSKIRGDQTRQENRKAKLRELLDGLSRLRLCGPSDDPDEHTSAIESYRYLLINVKALSKGLLPRDVSEQLDAVPSNLESIYDVYKSKAHLDAVCVDIEAELENPITMPTGSVPAPQPEGDDLEKWHLVLMAAEAPTLKDLKALSISKQAQLLLRRLATQYPRSDMTFGKMNFAIQAHADDLASGYPPGEVLAVKDLLLSAPWRRLESDGFISDNGQNFFHVTTEGYEAAKKSDAFFSNREVIDALKLLHLEFQDYAHYFYEDKLQEAIAAAFERYENRLNEIRDGSKNAQVMAASGHPLVYKLFDLKILKEPYPTLGGNPTTKAAYEKGLTGIMSGGVSWLRNARTHEKHNLPPPTPEETLELLFVASYLMRMLDLSHR